VGNLSYVPYGVQVGLCTRTDDTATIGDGTRIGSFSIIGEECQIGKDCRINDYVKLYPGTILGDRVMFDEYSNSSGAVVIGNDVMIKRMAIVGQGAIIENKAFIGPMTILVHERNISWQRDVNKISRGVYVHAGAVIGSRVVVNSGVTVGYNAIIGAGAVVTKDCEENGIYTGVPAVRVGTVPPERRLDVDRCPPIRFSDRVRNEYLPHLVAVGKYPV
jgi:acetyltransferase-like isoleucine patch superfamily enzyme